MNQRISLIKLFVFVFGIVMVINTVFFSTTVLADDRDIDINETNFPDENFRSYITDNFDTNPTDGKLSPTEIAAVTEIGLYYANVRNVTDLTGIEHFAALTKLDVGSNQLTTLDLSNNTLLTEINCSYNNLTSLNISGLTNLKNLYCNNNSLTQLDVSSNNSLETLLCQENHITTVQFCNGGSLYHFNCRNNKISQLDTSNLPNLKLLRCDTNNLTKLDVSNNTLLEELEISNNNITSIDLSNCPSLNVVKTNNNVTYISIACPDVYDISALGDVSKMSNIQGGTLSGNMLTVDSNATEVKYDYNMGNNTVMTVTIDVTITHSTTAISAKEATCFVTGNNEYYNCTKCGNYFKDEKGTIPTTIKAETLKVLEHAYEWKIDKPATENEDGIKHEECTLCGTKKNENTIIPKLPSTVVEEVTTAKTTSTTETATTEAEKPVDVAPQTGDETNIFILISILLISSSCILNCLNKKSI